MGYEDMIKYSNKMIYEKIARVLDILRHNKHFQNYINTRYDKNKFVLVRKVFLEDDIFCVYKGLKFIVNDQIDTIHDVYTEYNFSDIKHTDIVLDIGANIGAFSLLSSKNAKHVFAVEPLFNNIIDQNILKNNITNITVLKNGLGVSGIKYIKYGDRSEHVKMIQLNDIIKLCGGHVDFMKIDCEGGEWCIHPHELDGIRRIEAEVHCFNGEKQTDFIDMLIVAGYMVDTNRLNNHLMIVHAQR